MTFLQKHTHLQAAQSSRTDLILQKSVLFPYQKKLKNKKFLSLQKNKTSQPHSPRQTITNIYSRHFTTEHLRAIHGDTNDSSTGGNKQDSERSARPSDEFPIAIGIEPA
jgi:hypothetical protein